MAARIFISYCNGSDATRQLRNEIAAALSGHKVFIDELSVRLADDWRARIYHALAECHAVVFLLDSGALKSPWVRKEANIVLWRRALGASVMIIPVLLDGVTAPDIEAAGLAELLEVQHTRPARRGPAGGGGVVPEVVRAVSRLRVGGRRSSDPMQEWTSRVVEALATLDDGHLAVSADAFGAADGLAELPGRTAQLNYVAHQLLHQGIDRRACDTLARIKRGFSDEQRRNLIEEIIPTWVDGDAARLLLHGAADRRPVVLLNARLDRTARQYFERATCRSFSGYRCAVAGELVGEQSVADVSAALQAAVRELARLPPRIPIEEIVPPPGLSFLVVDPGGVPLPAVGPAIEALRRDFPWVNLIVLVGRAHPDEPTVRRWLPEAPYLLLPALAKDDELVAYQLVEDLVQLVPERMRGDVR
ncbi:toll/interleukin-1 receptor domain-containing protein [Actinoplanes sp. NPDC051475]|uniref:toll/interleukin-1 receptor domain-containing protein n=1 Tax=Actinoplanes sp. NPDC051475 TaxID=3157225 RepID=UPI00344BBB4E